MKEFNERKRFYQDLGRDLDKGVCPITTILLYLFMFKILGTYLKEVHEKLNLTKILPAFSYSQSLNSATKMETPGLLLNPHYHVKCNTRTTANYFK